jgi:hypothetical protein
LYTIQSAHPVHFLMAVVAACAISVSLTSMAAITGLISDPSASVKRPAFLNTIARHLPGAAPVEAEWTAVQVAPAAKLHAKTSTAIHRKHRPAAPQQ